MHRQNTFSDTSLSPMQRRRLVGHGDVDERIDALAASFVDRMGDRALDAVIRQFDASDGEVRLVWGRIMEWLLLHREVQSST